MSYEDYRINGITAIDVNSMSVAKYGEKEKSSGGGYQQNQQEKRKYKEIHEEKELHIQEEGTKKRKEYSLQEHMQFMIWMGKKNIVMINQ